MTALRLGALAMLSGAAACTTTERRDDPAPRPITRKVKTFLMFEGQAEEAMNFYVSLFDDAKIVDIERFGPGEEGAEGSLKAAVFSLEGQEFMCFNSRLGHPFTFTPSISMFVTCESEAELDRLYATISEDGEVFMPLDVYPFSRKFGWVADRFGVSWQLNLPHE